MAFAFEQLRARGGIVEVALGAFASASIRRRSANAVYCASAQSTASSCDTPPRASSIVCSKLASIG
jgi:hypothetical protein